MDISQYRSSGGGDGIREISGYSTYGVVLDGVAQSSWTESGAAWTSGSGYLEKIGNGSDFARSSIIISGKDFDLLLDMSIADLGSASSYIWLEDTSTGEDFLPWFNADVTGTVYLASISSVSWAGLAYAVNDTIISSGGRFQTTVSRRGDVMHWEVNGGVASFAAARSGLGSNSIQTGILPDTKTVRIYNYLIRY